MSVSAAASLLKFSDWSKFTSADLAKKLEALGITPRPGKRGRQAQLNVWEMGWSWLSKSHDPFTTASAAEDRLIELYGLRASEARTLATKYDITSAAEASNTRLIDLIKRIFVYEFMVARPTDLTSLSAPTVEQGAFSAAAAAAAAAANAVVDQKGYSKTNATSATLKPTVEQGAFSAAAAAAAAAANAVVDHKGYSKTNAASATLKSAFEVRAKAIADKARVQKFKDSLDQVDRDLQDVIDNMANELRLKD